MRNRVTLLIAVLAGFSMLVLTGCHHDEDHARVSVTMPDDRPSEVLPPSPQNIIADAREVRTSELEGNSLMACGTTKGIESTQTVANAAPVIEKTDKEWKKILTPEQYRVLRKKGTERAFTGQWLHHEDKGDYTCAACGTTLFTSNEKFDSGTGWPSFYDVANCDNIKLKEDRSWGMSRVEVLCATCGGHLGHVFADGPEPTGKRYCINSVSLDFQKYTKPLNNASEQSDNMHLQIKMPKKQAE